MSFSTEQDVQCPGCGEEFGATLWSSINAQEMPGLREEILAGQLNVVKCSSCGQMLYAEKFILYHDPGAELMAFVYPKSYQPEAETWRAKAAEDFKAAQDAVENKQERLRYGPCVLFGLDALVDILNAEQEQSVQGAILESLSESLPIELCRLDVALAREKGLPRLLPLGKDKGRPPADRLKEGLRLLLLANDRLTVYADVLERLASQTMDISVLLS